MVMLKLMVHHLQTLVSGNTVVWAKLWSLVTL